MKNSFVIKSDFAYCKNKNEIATFKNSYLVCVDGISKGIYKRIPKQYSNLKQYDYSGKLTIPGMIDLHIHAPQFAYRGMYMDEELLDWLKKYTFVEEAKYDDIKYADTAYTIFANALKKSATTRVSIFATVHRKATVLLMDKMEKTGLISYIGKINMDRDAPINLLDKSVLNSAFNTFGFINETKDRYKRTFPILTPRFIPSCTNELLNELKEISRTYDIPIQSHLSESPGEVELVHKLMPDVKTYGEGYDRFGLFGGHSKTIMAHCIYSTEREVNLMKKNGVFIAHCPSSNLNLRSGIAPIAKYLDMDLKVGLGSDVAGGESESIFNEIKKAIEVSKMYKRYIDDNSNELSFSQGFYLATLGGGEFFGKVGSFDKGYEVDAVVLNDKKQAHPQRLDVKERLERSVYLGIDNGGIVAKFVRGKKVI